MDTRREPAILRVWPEVPIDADLAVELSSSFPSASRDLFRPELIGDEGVDMERSPAYASSLRMSL